MSCWTAPGAPSSRFAADGLSTGRRGRREDEACSRKREIDVHVALPHAGHVSGPTSKHSSQSRHRARDRSGRWTRGAGFRLRLIIDVRPPGSVKGRVNPRQDYHVAKDSYGNDRTKQLDAVRPRFYRPCQREGPPGLIKSLPGRGSISPRVLRGPSCARVHIRLGGVWRLSRIDSPSCSGRTERSTSATPVWR